MSARPLLEELLRLVDRAEFGCLLAGEARLMREGIRELAAARPSRDTTERTQKPPGVLKSFPTGQSDAPQAREVP